MSPDWGFCWMLGVESWSLVKAREAASGRILAGNKIDQALHMYTVRVKPLYTVVSLKKFGIVDFSF